MLNIFCLLCNNALTHFAGIATDKADISGFFFQLNYIFINILFKYSDNIILCKYSVIFYNLFKNYFSYLTSIS